MPNNRRQKNQKAAAEAVEAKRKAEVLQQFYHKNI
jgi:hypothetical protein